MNSGFLIPIDARKRDSEAIMAQYQDKTPVSSRFLPDWYRAQYREFQ